MVLNTRLTDWEGGLWKQLIRRSSVHRKSSLHLWLDSANYAVDQLHKDDGGAEILRLIFYLSIDFFTLLAADVLTLPDGEAS